MASESHKTVYVALAANAGIAVAKGVGGALSGSSAMLAEAAHSVADTTNQLLLLASLRLSERKPDAQHPFGYGKERFLWSFMAAIFIFVSGALFSIYEGVERMLSGKASEGSAGIAFAVLAVALVLEGTLAASAPAARRTARRERPAAAVRPPHPRLAATRPTKTVVFEDSAAVIGVLLAAGRPRADADHRQPGVRRRGVGLIGVLLAVVAFALWPRHAGAADRRGGAARGARGDRARALRPLAASTSWSS